MSFTLIHTTLRAVLATLFPDRCVGCQKKGVIFCAVCRGQLHPRATLCIGCDVAQFDDSSLCRKCAKRQHIPLDKLFVVFSYHTPIVRASIHALKYHNMRRLAPILAAGAEKFAPALREAIGRVSEESAVLAPVPLSRRRLRERGFNQSALIAGELAKILHLPLNTNLLKKIIETKPQVEMTGRKERLANMRDAFAIRDPESIKRKTILLVDDVITTGATMAEAARTLKKAGTSRIIGIALANG